MFMWCFQGLQVLLLQTVFYSSCPALLSWQEDWEHFAVCTPTPMGAQQRVPALVMVMGSRWEKSIFPALHVGALLCAEQLVEGSNCPQFSLHEERRDHLKNFTRVTAFLASWNNFVQELVLWSASWLHSIKFLFWKMLLEIFNSSPASNTTGELDSFCPGTAWHCYCNQRV